MNAKSLKKKSHTNWGKVDKLSDKEIDTSDIAPLDEKFFKNTEISLRPPKKSLTLRLDADVLEWFRKKGEGYQTRINAILRTYMKAHSSNRR